MSSAAPWARGPATETDRRGLLAKPADQRVALVREPRFVSSPGLSGCTCHVCAVGGTHAAARKVDRDGRRRKRSSTSGTVPDVTSRDRLSQQPRDQHAISTVSPHERRIVPPAAHSPSPRRQVHNHTRTSALQSRGSRVSAVPPLLRAAVAASPHADHTAQGGHGRGRRQPCAASLLPAHDTKSRTPRLIFSGGAFCCPGPRRPRRHRALLARAPAAAEPGRRSPDSGARPRAVGAKRRGASSQGKPPERAPVGKFFPNRRSTRVSAGAAGHGECSGLSAAPDDQSPTHPRAVMARDIADADVVRGSWSHASPAPASTCRALSAGLRLVVLPAPGGNPASRQGRGGALAPTGGRSHAEGSEDRTTRESSIRRPSSVALRGGRRSAATTRPSDERRVATPPPCLRGGDRPARCFTTRGSASTSNGAHRAAARLGGRLRGLPTPRGRRPPGQPYRASVAPPLAAPGHAARRGGHRA